MKNKFKFSSSFKSKIKDLEKISGVNQIPVSELLTSEFLDKNTNFDDVSLFIASMNASGINILNEKEFDAVDDEIKNLFVVKYTEFSSWQEMISAAGKNWVENQLKGIFS